MYVNLLPMSFVRRLTIRRQAWRWGFAIALALLLCSVIVAAQYLAVLAAQQKQTITAFQSKDLHSIQADTQRITDELKSLEAAITSLHKARPDDRTLVLLGIASTSAKKASGKVQLKQLMTQTASAAAASVSSSQPPGASNRKAAEPAGEAGVTNDFVLEGVADNAVAIASFVDALRETAVFTRVDLTATTETVTSTGATRQFRVDCKY